MTVDVEGLPGACRRARRAGLGGGRGSAARGLIYTSSRGERLMKEGCLEFLGDGPLRWNRQWVEDALVE